jgi:tetratricopeptide (TPR) repeat protein
MIESKFPRACPAVAALFLSIVIVQAGPADELIAKGNVYYEKLDAQEALKYYLPAEKLEPKNVRLLVRISREYRHLMSDASKTEEKLRLGGIAVDYAKRAAALGPNDPEAQLAVAISYGKLQPLESTKEKVETARIIKSEADKAIKLDPRSDLAWHVLGRWNMGYAEVTSVKRALAELVYGKLPVTTYEDAAKCFEKAIELKPDRLIHYIELGQVYSQMGRTADARRVITKGLAMKETEKDDPETKQRGRETLAKLR